MKMQTSAGIIVNTFEKLEPRAIRAIVDDKWTLISSNGGDDGRLLETATWLDSQPRGSVGKLLVTHHPSLSIHILITNQAYDAGSTTAHISFVSATVPSIIFHFFPATTLPPDFSTTSPHHETLAFEILRLNNPNVHRTLTPSQKITSFTTSSLTPSAPQSPPSLASSTSPATISSLSVPVSSTSSLTPQLFMTMKFFL